MGADDSLRNSKVNFGAVVKGRLEDVEKLKDFLASDKTDLLVIFQKTTVERLWIKEGRAK